MLNNTDLLASIAQNFGDPILFRVFIDAESKNTTVHGLYVSITLHMISIPNF